jgi:sortase A
VVSRTSLLRGGAIACLAAGALVLAQGLWIPVKADIAQLLLAQAWTRAIDGESAPTPWPWADTWPVARLSVPQLGEHAIVLAEAGGEALAFGPSLLNASAAPGENGVSVIAAHRDTHFAFLQHVEAGQTIVVERPDGPPALYRVTGSEIVEADRSGIQVEGGPPRLALVTCWPFGSITPGPLRYVVWAEAVDMNTI